MPKAAVIYLLYILSDFALTGLDIYVWKFHPKIFESYYDLIGIVFALWTIFATVWIFRSDAKALGKRLSYSMVLALVFILPIGSGVHFFGTRNWKTGLLLYVGFWVGIIGSLYINFSLFEWATGSPTLGG